MEGTSTIPFKTRELLRKRMNLTVDLVDSWMAGHRAQSMWNAQMRFRKYLVPAFLNGDGIGQVACDIEEPR